MKQILGKDEVEKAMGDLVGQGKKPTLNALHAALNHRGSMSTLVRLKAEIDAAAQPVSDSPEGLKAFREVWALAVEEGRQRQEAVIGELRENLKVLASENERLEGTAIAAQNHATEREQAAVRAEAELRQVKASLDGELKRANTALAEASSLAAGTLQKLTEAQAAHSTQVAALQSDLAAAVRKAHELELQVVRNSALLEAKGIRPGM